MEHAGLQEPLKTATLEGNQLADHTGHELTCAEDASVPVAARRF